MFDPKMFARSSLLLTGSLVLGACATQPPPSNVYMASQTQQEESVRMAVIESVRQVTIQGQPNGVGVGAGAVVGGLAGSAIGNGNGSIVTAILGAVAGGVAGQAIENSANKSAGVELTVRLDNGEMLAIVQAVDPNDMFQPGDRVRILSRGGVSRVTH